MARTKSQKARRYAAATAKRIERAAITRKLIEHERLVNRSLNGGGGDTWHKMATLSQVDKSSLQRSEQSQSFSRSTANDVTKLNDVHSADVDIKPVTRSNSYPSHSRHDLKLRLARAKQRRIIKAAKLVGYTPARARELFAAEYPADYATLYPDDNALLNT